MKIGTKAMQITPHKVEEELFSPEKVKRVVTAVLMNATGYISDRELDRVIEWVQKENPQLKLEVMRICRSISKGIERRL